MVSGFKEACLDPSPENLGLTLDIVIRGKCLALKIQVDFLKMIPLHEGSGEDGCLL